MPSTRLQIYFVSYKTLQFENKTLPSPI